MTTQLNYRLARERVADFPLSVERALIAVSGGSSRLASRRRGSITRLPISRRLRVVELGLPGRFTQAPTVSCGEDGVRS